MPLTVLQVLIVFTISSSEFRRAKLLWLQSVIFT